MVVLIGLVGRVVIDICELKLKFLILFINGGYDGNVVFGFICCVFGFFIVLLDIEIVFVIKVVLVLIKIFLLFLIFN